MGKAYCYCTTDGTFQTPELTVASLYTLNYTQYSLNLSLTERREGKGMGGKRGRESDGRGMEREGKKEKKEKNKEYCSSGN